MPADQYSMSTTCTAQITIGASMGGWGQPGRGIGAGNVMYLLEASRPVWILEQVVHMDPNREWKLRTWIPSAPDRILAGGLLMIATILHDDEELEHLIERRFGPALARDMRDRERVDLTRLEDREGLIEVEEAACRAIDTKLVITTTGGSSITRQLGLLERGSMDVEVCTPTWARAADSEGEPRTAGALPPEDPEAHGFYAVRI